MLRRARDPRGEQLHETLADIGGDPAAPPQRGYLIGRIVEMNDARRRKPADSREKMPAARIGLMIMDRQVLVFAQNPPEAADELQDAVPAEAQIENPRAERFCLLIEKPAISA